MDLKIWRYPQSPYLCNVFFIVLDLRLTKDWLSGIDSLFFMLICLLYPVSIQFSIVILIFNVAVGAD